MELKKRLRPTMINTNARFRGPTESLKHVNMVNETVHDLILLSSVLNGNEKRIGHSDLIKNNFSKYVNGVESPTASNIESASTIYTKGENLTTNDWELHKLELWATTSGLSIAKNEESYIVDVAGTVKPAKMYVDIEVDVGDILFMRVGIIHSSQDQKLTSIKIGSENVNQNVPSFLEYPLPKNASIGYIDHMIECLYRETITLEINVLPAEAVSNSGQITILFPEMKKLHKREVKLIPTNTEIKARLNDLEAEIENLSR